MSKTQLQFDGVTKRFGEEAVVADVSFTVEAGEQVAVVGRSGAGKTTLLRLANGSLRPDEGRIRIDGRPVSASDIALAYQGETLIEHRSALENVLSGKIGRLPWWRGLFEPLFPRTPEPARELLAAVGLNTHVHSRVDTLSAGQRQRVAFARALIQDAPVLLADEPTANLDPSTRERVIETLQSVVDDRLLVTVLHDIDLALERYERVIGLREGRVVFDESTETVTDAMLGSLFESERPTTETETTHQHTQPTDTTPKWYV